MRVVIGGLLCALMVVVSSLTTPADYTCRLYFENLTTGKSNTGAVLAMPGDLIAIKFFFHDTGGSSWGTFQMVIFDSPVIGTFANWNTQTANALIDGLNDDADFLIIRKRQNQDLYDDRLNPGNTTKTKLGHGAYLGLGIDGSTYRAKNWDVTFYTFTAGGKIGDELRFGLINRVTGTGLSTSILDNSNYQFNPVDNYVVIGKQQTKLRGQIQFDRIAPGASPPPFAEVRMTPEVGDVILFPDVPVDGNGFFEVTVPADRYTVAVRSASWVRRTGFADLSESDISNFHITLPAGDAFADNVVDIRDLNMVLVYFGQPGAPYSDLNRDGATDVKDLNIVLGNFRLVGDP